MFSGEFHPFRSVTPEAQLAFVKGVVSDTIHSQPASSHAPARYLPEGQGFGI